MAPDLLRNIAATTHAASRPLTTAATRHRSWGPAWAGPTNPGRRAPFSVSSLYHHMSSWHSSCPSATPLLPAPKNRPAAPPTPSQPVSACPKPTPPAPGEDAGATLRAKWHDWAVSASRMATLAWKLCCWSMWNRLRLENLNEQVYMLSGRRTGSSFCLVIRYCLVRQYPCNGTGRCSCLHCGWQAPPIITQTRITTFPDLQLVRCAVKAANRSQNRGLAPAVKAPQVIAHAPTLNAYMPMLSTLIHRASSHQVMTQLSMAMDIATWRTQRRAPDSHLIHVTP